MPRSSHTHRLLFRLRASQIRQGVDLRGDLVHWQLPVPLVGRAGSDWLEAELDAPPGVYRYKFHTTDDGWLLDPHNGRTWERAGAQDSLLVIGGTDEPVAHAPVAPWLFVEDDGRLCVRAALRRAAADRLAVRWDEGHGARRTPLSAVAIEGEHALLEAHLPASAESVRYGFELADGRVVGRAGTPGALFEARLRDHLSRAPQWWADATLYTVFVDRFRRGGADGRWDDAPVPASPAQVRAIERARAGGDLRGLLEVLPYLVDLGVTALHLTPIVLARSAHRYDSVDPRSVDEALGGELELRALLTAAHRVGLRILLDVTLTHVHRDFFAFRQVREHGPRSEYWDWFRPFTFPFREGPEPGYDHYQKGQWEEPLLRTDSPAVMSYLVETLEHWARLGADGFRIDAAADVPLELLARIREAVRAHRPDAVIIGELTVDNAARYTESGLDAATDFVSQQALYDWLWRRRSSATDYASAVTAHRFLQSGPGWTAIGLTATHDQPRLSTLLGDCHRARLGHVLQLASAAVPAIYYGDEVGLTSGEPGRSFEDAWPDRCRMAWHESEWDGETLALFRTALAARRESRALRRGSERFVALRSAPERDDDTEVLLCLRRQAGDEIVDVLVNASPVERRVALPAGAPDAGEALFAAGDGFMGPDPGLAHLGPWSALALRRVSSQQSASATRELADEGPRLCALAFREGLTEALALPTHLAVTVTEACNLRCRHCLNHSPERTRRRTARELRPWLLDRLGESLAAADYLALSHGGESLCSPMLFPLLEAMARRHQARPGRYDVHLLSNGMLLEPDVVRRLVDAGVTSLAVSLDGGRAQSNDLVRLGGSFERVVANLQQAVTLRTALGADLRIGISTVLATHNVGELSLLGALVLDLGLDWLKLEELVPATPWARRNMLSQAEPRLPDALAALRELLAKASKSVVLVEHLDPPTGCRCQGEADEQLRAFRDADDFANRARFSPCRAAWEQACIEPDGAVHAIDYHHPSVGSLAERSMLQLWDGEPVQRLRRAALHRVPEAVRRSCPQQT